MMRFLILTSLLITAVGSFNLNLSRIAPSTVVLASRCQQQNRQPTTCDSILLQNQRRRITYLSSSARDEEIAKLEAQLRQLRESET
jgi:hypothetical protein